MNKEQKKVGIKLRDAIIQFCKESDTIQIELDNRIKITNLPSVSLIRIFTVNGTLIRTIKKSDNLTSVDWDLKNDSGIPVASGLYIIHINADGVGEKILKWFGVLRPIDLDTF